MSEDKRTALKERIEAAQESESARRAKKLGQSAKAGAVEAKDKFTAFANEHPVATVAGGVVVGVLVASLFKAPRRAAASTGAKAAGLAALGSEIAMSLLSEMRSSAGQAGTEGKRKLDDLGDSIGDAARRTRREAAYRSANASDTARIASREAGKAIMRVLKRH